MKTVRLAPRAYLRPGLTRVTKKLFHRQEQNMTKVANEIVERDGGRVYRFGEPFKRLSEDHMRRFMRTLFVVRGHLLALGMAVALSTPGSVLAQDRPAKALESAGVLAFGPDNVLFVGDTKGAA